MFALVLGIWCALIDRVTSKPAGSRQRVLGGGFFVRSHRRPALTDSQSGVDDAISDDVSFFRMHRDCAITSPDFRYR